MPKGGMQRCLGLEPCESSRLGVTDQQQGYYQRIERKGEVLLREDKQVVKYERLLVVTIYR